MKRVQRALKLCLWSGIAVTPLYLSFFAENGLHNPHGSAVFLICASMAVCWLPIAWKLRWSAQRFESAAKSWDKLKWYMAAGGTAAFAIMFLNVWLALKLESRFSLPHQITPILFLPTLPTCSRNTERCHLHVSLSSMRQEVL